MSQETPRRANVNNEAGSNVHRLVVADAVSSSGSTSSSLSSSVSASVWSMPRAGRGGAQRSSGLRLISSAKRSGTSFRVALRPSSYHQRQASGKGLHGHSICDPRIISSPAFLRRIILALILASLVATLYIMLDPTRVGGGNPGLKGSSYSNFALYDSLSIEDRVAQSEMSEEQVMSGPFSKIDAMDVPPKHKKVASSTGPSESYHWDEKAYAGTQVKSYREIKLQDAAKEETTMDEKNKEEEAAKQEEPPETAAKEMVDRRLSQEDDNKESSENENFAQTVVKS